MNARREGAERVKIENDRRLRETNPALYWKLANKKCKRRKPKPRFVTPTFIVEKAIPSIEDQAKPELTLADLEFDYDRTKMRDPRPSPGRVNRPRRGNWDMTEEFRSQFYVPIPTDPPGQLEPPQEGLSEHQQAQLKSRQQCERGRQTALLDPADDDYGIRYCHEKGREGSPCYDNAGYQYDWELVDDYVMRFQPKTNAARMAEMAEQAKKAMTKAEVPEQNISYNHDTMNLIFFQGGQGPKDVPPHKYDFYLKDHVSKDMGAPFHQLDMAKLERWGKMGFKKPIASDWWREPNEEEEARRLRVESISGEALRKRTRTIISKDRKSYKIVDL
ncbi:hypothetical protein BT63DRAFT_458315 [Microthyrium microscopicum]|uniref:Uncharacterized protein n=1 Tax=Microthyrium microscopicum TaxID=703497 RepID=A0A6A6U209_9PEZI|nr:hypothetical protein BT63DRAFT_458315 [Microthyrium microscopicum]